MMAYRVVLEVEVQVEQSAEELEHTIREVALERMWEIVNIEAHRCSAPPQPATVRTIVGMCAWTVPLGCGWPAPRRSSHDVADGAVGAKTVELGVSEDEMAAAEVQPFLHGSTELRRQ